MQTHQPLTFPIFSAPKIKHRILNHWDNLDGTIERGYAGHSLWDWHKLPDYLSPRYTDYARACASVGINGTVLTNVNANALILTRQYLVKVAALANVFRPYGIRVYLTARFSAPIEIGGLSTADPLDPAVIAWWNAKADEIYDLIPDFGGFVVKANSEGQPGPHEYGRSHADGANLLANALAPHGGLCMWRAFVYSHEDTEDRHKQAYTNLSRSMARSLLTLSCRSRTARLISCRANPIIRSLARCRKRRSCSKSRSRRNISVRGRIWPISRPCTKRCSIRIPDARARVQPSPASSTVHLIGTLFQGTLKKEGFNPLLNPLKARIAGCLPPLSPFTWERGS